MLFLSIYLSGLALIVLLVFILWIISVRLTNAGIVDIFWGFGFVVVNWLYYYLSGADSPRSIILLILVSVWGLRLTAHIGWRNWGKPEDFRYRKFRQDYGADRYWWVSFFQVFLLQGLLLWLISAPLLAVHWQHNSDFPTSVDFVALLIWLTGFVFEAGGDWQLSRFKAKSENKGKLLNSGFWRYTRHPNYFGDAAVWTAYSLFSVAAGSWWPVLSGMLMIFLLLKVSGVSLLEKTLVNSKPGYQAYVSQTNAFFPWFPKKH